MKKLVNQATESKPMVSLILAKIIALSVFCLVCLIMISEVFSFGSWGLPLLLTYVANGVGVTKGADWVIGGILWAFPSLFFTIVFALLHFYGWKAVLKRLWKWMIFIMKKSKPE